MLEETNRVREQFARLIGATTREVGILDATSAGENLVARSFDLGEGDNVHELCIDSTGRPSSVSAAPGSFTDPGDDLNPPTAVEVSAVDS